MTWWEQLHRGRDVSEVGYMPIKWSEILAWSRLYRLRPRRWELDALTMIDDTFLSIVAKKTFAMEDFIEEERSNDGHRVA